MEGELHRSRQHSTIASTHHSPFPSVWKEPADPVPRTDCSRALGQVSLRSSAMILQPAKDSSFSASQKVGNDSFETDGDQDDAAGLFRLFLADHTDPGPEDAAQE